MAHPLLRFRHGGNQTAETVLGAEKGETMSNVVSFSNRKDKEKAQQTRPMDPNATPVAQAQGSNESLGASEKPRSSFEDIAQKNRENQDRIRREREKANKNVLRSYRIK